MSRAPNAAMRLEATLYARIGPIVAGAGLDLIELKVGKGGRGLRIAVFIDRFAGGGRVTIEDCASVSRKISADFELDDPIAGAWELEVSSPGTNRRLRHAADATRYVGVRARVGLREGPEHGRETLIGAIVEADDAAITLKLDGGVCREVAWAAIRRAALDPTPAQWLEIGRQVALEQEAVDATQRAAQNASLASTASDDVHPEESAR